MHKFFLRVSMGATHTDSIVEAEDAVDVVSEYNIDCAMQVIGSHRASARRQHVELPPAVFMVTGIEVRLATEEDIASVKS